MLDLIVAAVVVYSLLVGILFVAQRHLMYFPDRGKPDFTRAGVPTMEQVVATTSDGLDLAMWYHPPARPGAPVVTLFQGNAGNMGHRGFKISPIIAAGFGVLLAEYRGYGGNPGSPTETGLYRDGRAALDVLKRKGIAPGQIVLYGESLGSAVAVQLATERMFRAVVLEAPFTSAADLAASHFWFVPARYLLWDRFESLAKIGRIRAPLLVIHGEKDAIVPVRHGRELFAAAPEPKQVRYIPEAGHNDLNVFGAVEAAVHFIGSINPIDIKQKN